MSAEMMFGVSHLLIAVAVVAFMVATVPGVVRTLSSEEAISGDWRRVFRTKVLPVTVFPAVFSFVAFLVTYQVTTGRSEIPLGVVTSFGVSFIYPGVVALLAVWGVVFLVVWHQRGMPGLQALNNGRA